MWLFKPIPKKLINKLARLEYQIQIAKRQIDEFENRNPIIGALGNAWGGISIGSSRNPQFTIKMAELNLIKKRLNVANRKKNATVQSLPRTRSEAG